MHVVGTAGHVDHGKSALVRALTGIDPDRLQEEKERGLTIDLGFAWLSLPSGEDVSIVDVPGHERFIKNMLAGVGGIDLALLVVAADEGVMPQTREHLAILDLLQVRRGIAVITKADLVEEDFLALVAEEMREVLAGTSLSGAPIMATSAQTRQGLDELIALLDRMLQETPPRPDLGRPRLPIDRAFTISGFGTVVTGTLIGGSLSVGQEVEIVPSGLHARVRGLQSHRQRLDSIGPGTRTAVNLAGVDASQLSRGLVLASPGWLRPTSAADTYLRMVSSAPGPLRHNQTVSFHWLAAEAQAHARLLDADLLEPGQEGWCQLLLDTPLPLVKGDFFVLRSAVGTLGGGQVVETFARRHRRRDVALLENLEALAGGDPREVVRRSLESSSPLSVAQLAERTALPLAQVQDTVTALTTEGDVVAVGEGSSGTLLYARGAWDTLKEQAASVVEAHHHQFPLRRGMSREELRSRLRASPEAFPLLLGRLQAEGVLIEEGSLVRRPTHQPRLSDAARRQADALLRRLRERPYTPPTDLVIDPELLAYLADQGEVVPVGDGIIYVARAYREIVDKIIARAKEKGTIAISDVREMFGTSRKYTLALLEHLDQQHITRRVGDERVLL